MMYNICWRVYRLKVDKIEQPMGSFGDSVNVWSSWQLITTVQGRKRFHSVNVSKREDKRVATHSGKPLEVR